jgi:hypothetical protein
MADRHRAALGLAVILAAPLLAGCGSSSTAGKTASASTPAALSSKAHFIAQAGAICSTLNKQEQPLKARQESLKGQTNASAGDAFVSLARQFVDLARAAKNKLDALPRPAADAQSIEQLLMAFSEEIGDASTIAVAAAKQESNLGEGAENSLRHSIARTAGLADAYGMKLCIGSE